MTTAKLDPRDLEIIELVRADARNGASWSMSQFDPAVKAGVADTRDEYALGSEFVSASLLVKLQQRALAALLAPRGYFNPTLTLRERTWSDEQAKRAVQLCELAIAPLYREWTVSWHEQLSAARRLFEADMAARR